MESMLTNVQLEAPGLVRMDVVGSTLPQRVQAYRAVVRLGTVAK